MGGAVIIGAGLGGLRTAESLRGSGYDGPITIVGDEVFYGTFASQKPRLMKALGLQ